VYAALVAWLTLTLAAPPPVPPGSPRSRTALDLCHQAGALADDAPGKAAQLDAAVAAAEEAVAGDDGDPLAHFALFCALGQRMRHTGVAFSSLMGLRRARREIDRTLELAPDFSDAIYGKAALLMQTPGLLGGDVKEGERLLRRTLELDPEYVKPRLDLARALADRGERTEARTQAERALAIAEGKGDAADVAAARALLDRLPAE
jgi:tetratricopeptide (TPR) repeat protein